MARKVAKKSQQSENHRLLVWPLCLKETPPSNSVLVGWKLCSDSTNLETVVVAGHIQQTDVAALQDKINALCTYYHGFECSCDGAMSGKSAHVRPSPEVGHCFACTAKLCFSKDLCLVATFVAATNKQQSNSETASATTTTTKTTIDLPIISMDPLFGHPWWDGTFQSNAQWNKHRHQQLLYYDTNGTIYRHCSHDNAQNQSYSDNDSFSRFLLRRLFYAPAVMEMLQNVRVPTQKLPHLEPTDNHHHNSNSHDQHSVQTTIGQWLFQHSLICRHFFRQGLLPRAIVVQYYWAYFQNKKRQKNALELAYVYETSAFLAQPSIHDAMIQAWMDWTLGLVLFCAVICLLHRQTNTTTIFIGTKVRDMMAFHFQQLGQGLDWLEHFPIGFKLCEQLTVNVGRELRAILALHEQFMGTIINTVHDATLSIMSPLAPIVDVASSYAIRVMLAWSTILGCSGWCAILFDLSQLCLVHLRILSTIFRKVYQAELYLLQALWRLFRGKKHNVLRQRTDTMEYDSTQLLLGTLLFAIALFLFTTIFVYHVFFACLDLLANAMASSILFVYVLVEKFPWRRVWLRITQSRRFTNAVYLIDTDVPSQQGDGAHVATLGTCAQGVATLLKQPFLVPVSTLIGRLLKYAVGLFVGAKPAEVWMKTVVD